MTTTYTNLVDEVLLNLSGYTMRQDRSTHLTADVTSSGTTINIDSTTSIGKGIIEIDEELIWLDTYDRVSSSASIPPYGRGFQGTVAAAHTSGTKVSIAPTFPKSTVKKAINDTIGAVFPSLFGVGVTTFTLTPTQTTYALPAEAYTILAASWSVVGPSKEWLPIKSWRHDKVANSTSFPTGNTISVYDGITPGRTIQVFYAKEPSFMTSNSDVFETVTGLPDSTRDVIAYGAAYRLASFVDPGRLTYTSAEADNADTKIQYGAGASTARFLLALYQERLNNESAKLRNTYPFRPHYTRY